MGMIASSCSMYQNIKPLAKNNYFNDDQVVVSVAFKANVYQFPGQYDTQTIVAQLNKDDIVIAIGFEKGFIKVLVNGKTGFISEQYFKSSIFFDAWKQQELLSMQM